MNTKERIADEALTLFSLKGYKGTSVKNIADAVGIKDSSLYKHFKSKQEILDTIVAQMGERMENLSETYGLPVGSDYEKAAKVYGNFDAETLAEFSKKIFLFYLNDPFVSRFWRMGNMERFRNPKVYRIFSHIFLEESIQYLSRLFGEMIRQKRFTEADPQVMAVNFYSPIFFLLSKYAGRPEDEPEALDMLDKQVREFYRIYNYGRSKFMAVGHGH